MRRTASGSLHRARPFILFEPSRFPFIAEADGIHNSARSSPFLTDTLCDQVSSVQPRRPAVILGFRVEVTVQRGDGRLCLSGGFRACDGCANLSLPHLLRSPIQIELRRRYWWRRNLWADGRTAPFLTNPLRHRGLRLRCRLNFGGFLFGQFSKSSGSFEDELFRTESGLPIDVIDFVQQHRRAPTRLSGDLLNLCRVVHGPSLSLAGARNADRPHSGPASASTAPDSPWLLTG